MAARDTTFCFTDIAGSTDILRRLGESRYDDLLERHRALIRTALADAGGREVKTEGDGFFVTFEDAAASLRFAVDAQRALGAADWPVPVRVRMGLHRGPGIVRLDGDYSSLAAHQAARVAAAAHGGQVLLTADVVRDVDPPAGTRLVHLGEHRLRDFDGGVALLHLAGVGLADGFPPVRATRQDHGLPLPRSSLVGREAELRQLRELLTTTPLITLHGPGGVGKTRLALEAAASMAASFPDGLHLVELSTLDDPSLVVHTIAATVGVRPVPGQDLLELLVRTLATGSRLVLLDSAERVLDPVAQVVEAIVRSCPGCTVLVTTTEPVRTPDERVVPLAPLPAPPEPEPGAPADDHGDLLASDAVRLLLQRATARGADLGDGTAAAPALAVIARRLDGIPLALELAAGRIADLGLDETLDGLDDRFALLTNGWRTALPRHRTLEAMVEWTVSLLDADERDLLLRLASLRGRWRPVDAMAVVAEPGASTSTDRVQRLVDRSLLWLDSDEPRRVRMFDTVRAYVEAHLSPEAAVVVHERKRRWLLRHLQALRHEPDARIRDEIDHLIADVRDVVPAGAHEDSDAAAEAAELGGLTAAWYEARGMWVEAIDRLQAAVDGAPAGAAREAARAALAHQLAMAGDAVAAADEAQRVLDSEDAPDVARALAYIVLTPPSAPRPEGGLDPLEEAVRLSGPPSTSLALAARVRIGLRDLANGSVGDAAERFREVVDLAARHGRTIHHAQALANLGGALIRTGKIDEAEAALVEGRQRAIEAQLPTIAAACLSNLGMIAMFRGDLPRAVELAEERLEISLRMGDVLGSATAHLILGSAAAGLGERERAGDAYRRAYDLFHKLGVKEGCATSLFNLVVLATGSENGRGEAARAGGELASLAADVTNPAIHALALYAVAGVAGAAGVADAAALLGAADRHRPEAVPLDPSDLEWLAAAEATLVAATSADEVAAGRARGGDLDLAVALQLAKSVADHLT